MPLPGVSKSNEESHAVWIEWLTGVLATLLVLAIIGWVIFEAATTSEQAPELSAEVLAIDPIASGWRVMIEVRNSGDQAAASVEVRAVLVDGTIAVDEAEATFDYVAAGSTARGGLIFAEDPTRHRLQVKPVGFVEP
jgi:uncharacterized protein (TIGR02588 family)